MKFSFILFIVSIISSLLGKAQDINSQNVIKTPSGIEIQFLRTNDNNVFNWNSSEKIISLNTILFSFDTLSPYSPYFPAFVHENNKYVLLNVICGSPCNIGYFLPLYSDGTIREVNDYIAFDLNSELVAFILDDSIGVMNLRTGVKQMLFPGKCNSAFIGYCIDTAYFKQNKLVFDWNAETFINSKKHEIKVIKLNKLLISNRIQ